MQPGVHIKLGDSARGAERPHIFDRLMRSASGGDDGTACGLLPTFPNTFGDLREGSVLGDAEKIRFAREYLSRREEFRKLRHVGNKVV